MELKTTCLAKFSEQYKKYEIWQEKTGKKEYDTLEKIQDFINPKNTSPAKQQPTIGVEFESFDFHIHIYHRLRNHQRNKVKRQI